MVKIERTNGENAKIAVASLEKEKQKRMAITTPLRFLMQ